MFDFHLDLTELVTYAVTTVGGVILVCLRKRIARCRKFWVDVLEGLRSLPDLEADVRGIQHYVAPNGGGSLMDSVIRMETAVTQLTERVDLIAQIIWAENDTENDVGRFYSNAAGEFTYVNQTIARWLGIGKNELIGWRYLNFIHIDDVDRVKRQWEVCRAEHRQFNIRYRLVTVTGNVIEVEMVATPIPEVAPIKCWIGSIWRLNNDS